MNHKMMSRKYKFLTTIRRDPHGSAGLSLLFYIQLPMKRIIFLTTFCFLLLSCNNNSHTDEQFKIENDKLIQEFKNENQNFIKENAYNLSDELMVKALDSIAKNYMVDKNKNLAEEFINTASGLKRLNFLKKYYTKVEIKELLKNVPENLKTNIHFIELKKHSKQ